MSGWALQPATAVTAFILFCFYALDVGLGFATAGKFMITWASYVGFYALDVGLGFATLSSAITSWSKWPFLCPRCRAGLCDYSMT